MGVLIRRWWLLERIGKWLDGRVPDPRNLIHACSKRNISDPREMTRDALQAELFICHKKLKELKEKAPLLRHQHLKRHLATAVEKKEDKTIS